MKIIALLTGRGNNTLPDKNILPVHGKPLLYYPAVAAKSVKEISDFYVSSESEKILHAANKLGYKKIYRPAKYARPDSQHQDVINHALEVIRDDGINPDILVVVLANCATIKSSWIKDCITIFKNDPSITACVPVYKDMDHHPFRAKSVDANGFLSTFFDSNSKSISTNRQDLPKCYFLCHNFWILNYTSIKEGKGQPPWVFMGDKVAPYRISESYDVHTIEDISRSEQWLRKEELIPLQSTENAEK